MIIHKMETTYEERLNFVMQNVNKVALVLNNVCKSNASKNKNSLCSIMKGNQIDKSILEGLSIHQIDMLYEMLART